ncbi:MAG TPA: GNAT family N-acetyltransferase [Rhodothermales bacterium]|nr:GNAT family N-acetyltransferase [Rhodothermales bacterium]
MQVEPEVRVFERFTVPVEVVVRCATQDDLDDMEWFGRFTHHREIIEEAYERQEEGTNVMLVADVNGAPVGQVWIDLERKADEGIGVLWAIRVFPWFRNMKIGSHLSQAAERLLCRRGYRYAELGVEKLNAAARRFYERHGYEVVGELHETYDYTTPSGRHVHTGLDEWTMRKRVG